MDNLKCSDCKYKEDFSLMGCVKCNSCGWGSGESMDHTNFAPILDDDEE